jgi:hypothetical protein
MFHFLLVSNNMDTNFHDYNGQEIIQLLVGFVSVFDGLAATFLWFSYGCSCSSKSRISYVNS